MVLGTPVNENSGTLMTSNIDHGFINTLINNGYNNITKNDNSLNLKITGTTKSQGAKTNKKENSTVNAPTKTNQYSVKQEKDYYCIVLASQVTKNNAEDFVKRLGKQGYDEASVLIEKNRSIKVIYGHYTTQGEAYNELNNLRGNDNFYDAWVYQVKN